MTQQNQHLRAFSQELCKTIGHPPTPLPWEGFSVFSALLGVACTPDASATFFHFLTNAFALLETPSSACFFNFETVAPTWPRRATNWRLVIKKKWEHTTLWIDEKGLCTRWQNKVARLKLAPPKRHLGGALAVYCTSQAWCLWFVPNDH